MLADYPLNKSLAKVIIAAGWADGKLQPEEADCLKDLIFQLPDLSEEDWGELKLLVDEPVCSETAAAFIEELRTVLKHDNSLDYAYYALDRIVLIDGPSSEAQLAALETMRNVIRELSQDKLTEVRSLFEEPMRTRKRISETHNPFSKQDIEPGARISSQWPGQFDVELVPEEMERLTLAGVVISIVIHADERIDDEEIRLAIQYLGEEWKLPHEKAEFVVQISLDQDLGNIDLIRACRCLYECTNESQRLRLLDILFEIANSDGVLTQSELDHIMGIAAHLRLEQHHFQLALDKAMRSTNIPHEG